MKKLFLILSFLMWSFLLIGQVNVKDLKGTWTSNNTDSLFFVSDTIEFIKSDKRIYCNNANWSIQGKKKFSITYCNCCVEPPIITKNVFPQKIKLKNNQITIFINNIQHDKFEIIQFSDFEINGTLTKKLKLLRIH